MRTRQFFFLTLLTVLLGIPSFAHAQQSLDDVSARLIGNAFDTAVADAVPAQNEVPHPTPEHTGFSALVHDTWDDFKAFPRRRSTWVILGVGAGAALLAHPIDDDVNRHLAGETGWARVWGPGKFLGAAYTQVGVSLGLYAIGRYIVPPDDTRPVVEGSSPRTNKWSHMGFDLLRAQILSQAMVHATKYAVRRDRPTGVCCSFPSGHAATAWAAAAVIERHFGYRMALPTIVLASYVAGSRLHENVHFLSDVLMGSAIGTATGWTVVGRHGRSDYAFTPVPIRGGMAFQISRVKPGV